MIANFSNWFVFKGGGSEISVKISRSSLWVSLSLMKSKSFVILFSELSSLLLSLLMLRHFRVLFIRTAWHNFVSASWIDRSLLRQILNVFFLMLPRSCLRLLLKKSGCLAVGTFLNFPIFQVWSDLFWRRAALNARLTCVAAEQQLRDPRRAQSGLEESDRSAVLLSLSSPAARLGSVWVWAIKRRIILYRQHFTNILNTVFLTFLSADKTHN